jgi:hypothetical protein
VQPRSLPRKLLAARNKHPFCDKTARSAGQFFVGIN